MTIKLSELIRRPKLQIKDANVLRDFYHLLQNAITFGTVTKESDGEKRTLNDLIETLNDARAANQQVATPREGGRDSVYDYVLREDEGLKTFIHGWVSDPAVSGRLRSDPDPRATHEAAQQVIQERVEELRSEFKGRTGPTRSPRARAMWSFAPWIGLGVGLLATGVLAGYLALRKRSASRGTQRHTAAGDGVDHAAMHAAPPALYRYEADEKYFREHFEANFAHSGRSFGAYEPAYRLGMTLARDNYRLPWGDAELEAKRRWEASHNAPWGTFEAAVRYGYERGRMHEPQPKVHPA